MYLGIDLGTSGVKAILIDDAQRLVGEAASAPFAVTRPFRCAAEQQPDAWWTAVETTLDALAADKPREMAAVTGMGLSGQMYSATLLDAADRPIRPAMLWSDTRANAECAVLEGRAPGARALAGRPPTPFTTAAKLVWVQRHEPRSFERLRMVVLPKDYVRLHLTGEKVSDVADSSATYWIDIDRRDWSDTLLAASGLDRTKVPRLVEGTAVSARLRPALAQRWGMARPPVVAGGGGDNHCGACGAGAVQPGVGTVSIGTSGVLFAATDRPAHSDHYAIETLCHSVPGTWNAMSVILSAASCLNWLAGLLKRPAADLVRELGETPRPATPLLFLPFLDGAWSPRDDADVRGAFVNLAHGTDDAALTHAVLQGVCFALASADRAFRENGAVVTELLGIGGGSRSGVWLAALADSLGTAIVIPAASQLGAAFGAARLGLIAATGADPRGVLTKPPTAAVIEPDPARAGCYADAFAAWQALYEPVRTASAALAHAM